MADLAARAVGAVQDLAAQDDAAADACSQGDHDDIPVAFAAAAPHLAQCRYIGVITDLYFGAVQQSGQGGLYIIYAPAQVDTSVYDTGFCDRSGNADADAFHVIRADAFFGHAALDRCRNIRKDLRAAVIFYSGNFPSFHKSAVCLEQTAFDGRTAYINTISIFFHTCTPHFTNWKPLLHNINLLKE